jgi:transcriptional regulator with AAA-type ATPase domain
MEGRLVVHAECPGTSEASLQLATVKLGNQLNLAKGLESGAISRVGKAKSRKRDVRLSFSQVCNFAH